jgi:hypothetical protein
MLPQDIREYVTEWRKLEDKFYRTVLNEAEMYMLAIRLVRALTDTLTPIADLPTLIDQFQRSSSEDVIPIADSLEAPQVMVLDYQLALGAAFYLRAQEIQDELALAEMQGRIAAARAQGQRWVIIYDREQKRYGKRLPQRLEMRVADGMGLYAAGELDMEKGLVYAVEPMMFDLTTGKQRQGIALPEPRQEFATYEAMMQAFEALRQKYS